MGLHILFLWVALVQSPSLSLVVAGPMSEVTELKAMVADPDPVVSGFVIVIPGISGWEIFLWWVPAWPDIARMIPKGRSPLRLRMFQKSLWSYWTTFSSTHWIHLSYCASDPVSILCPWAVRILFSRLEAGHVSLVSCPYREAATGRFKSLKDLEGRKERPDLPIRGTSLSSYIAYIIV